MQPLDTLRIAVSNFANDNLKAMQAAAVALFNVGTLEQKELLEKELELEFADCWRIDLTAPVLNGDISELLHKLNWVSCDQCREWLGPEDTHLAFRASERADSLWDLYSVDRRYLCENCYESLGNKYEPEVAD